MHDYKLIKERFPIGSYEFHLSYREVLGDLGVDSFGNMNSYSIHMPDYINSNQLADPFSDNILQATQSKLMIERVVNFCKDLQQKTGRMVPIVGSFSSDQIDLDSFYNRCADFLYGYSREGVMVLPQWLPPIAWYFGGSIKLNVFNNIKDIELIKKYQLPICMDISHLCMGEVLFDFKAQNVIDELNPLIKHLHIADSVGIDGEGVNFGEGDIKNLPVIKASLKMDCMKVIEVWQGHLDQGEGFAKALNALYQIAHN
jgi:N-acetylneuraminate synthase